MAKINLDNVGAALDILSFTEENMVKKRKRKKKKEKDMGSIKDIALKVAEVSLDAASKAEKAVYNTAKKAASAATSMASEFAKKTASSAVSAAKKAASATASAASAAVSATASAANAAANAEIGKGITVKTVAIVLAAGAAAYGIYRATQYQTFKKGQGKDTDFTQNNQTLPVIETLKGWGI